MEQGDGANDLIGASIAQYRIEALIGRGGMGEVYRARDTKLDRTVAIKSLRTDASATQRPEDLVREAKRACRVNHPHLAAVHDVIWHGERPLIVMEYVRGRKLSDFIGGEPLPAERLIEITGQITDALGAVHRAGLLHRDLKPANVMIMDGGGVKVLDFGLAAPIPPVIEATDESTVTYVTLSEAAHSRAGTVPYMSPEQLQGRRLDHRSDLFSLGIILFECLTGRHPFDNSSLAAVASSIVNDPPRKPRRATSSPRGAALGRICLRLLEKTPQDRYATARALADDLAAARTAPTEGWSPSRRVALGAVLAAVVLVSAFVLWRNVGVLTGPVVEPPGRPALAILPLADDTGETPAKASMVGGLIEAQLSNAEEIRPVPRHRVLEVRSTAANLSHARMLRKVAHGVSAPWLVEGRLFRDDGYVATFDLHNANDATSRSFSVTASTAVELARRAARELRELIGGAPAGPERSYLASESDEAQESFERARQAFRDLDFALARELLDSALALDADFLGAHLLLADVLYRMGYQQKARETSEAAARIVRARGLPEDSRAALLVDGTHARMSSRTDDTIAAYDRLLDRFPEDVEVATALARAYDRKGDAVRAIELYDRALRYDRLDPRLHLGRADLLVTTRRFDAAERSIEEAERILETFSVEGGAGAVEDSRAYVAYRRQDWETALAAWRRAVDAYERAGLVTNSLDPRKAMADVWLQRWELDASIRTLEEILPEASQAGHLDLVARTLGSLGAAYYRARELDEAGRVLDRAVANARELERPALEHSALISLSGVLIAANRVEPAHAAIVRALELSRQLDHPVREAHGLLKLAHWYRITGDADGVGATLEPMLADDAPDRIGRSLQLSAWQVLAEAEVQFEFPGRALEASAEAVRLAEALGSDPRTGFTLCLEVRALVAVGEIARARDALDRASNLLGEPRPGTSLDTNLRLARAAVTGAEGDWSAVVGETEEVAAASAELRVARAEALVRLGRHEDALAALADGEGPESVATVFAARAALARARALEATGAHREALAAARRGADVAKAAGQALGHAELCHLRDALAAPDGAASRGTEAAASVEEFLDRVPAPRREWVIANVLSPDLRRARGAPNDRQEGVP